MSFSVDELLKKGIIVKKLGSPEEEFVKEKMKKEFDMKFDKKELIVGYKDNKEPKRHEFDLVSEDGNIVIEVKGGKGIVGKDNENSAGISTCFHDCYLLTKIEAKEKILALTNKDMFDIFKKKSDGIINNDNIQVRYFDMERGRKITALHLKGKKLYHKKL